MASVPKEGVYRFKHVETGTMLTLSSESSVIGSKTDAGTKSRWRLSPAKDVPGGYHVTNVADDKYLYYYAPNNKITMSSNGIWFLESTGKPNEYYFHMQWNHYVAMIDKFAHLNAGEKWILEFIGPLDKILPAPTLHQNVHYPFAPGNYVIRNVGTDTVMDLDAVSKKVVGHQANGNKSQEWHLRPTAVGTCMAIKTLDGGMTGVLDLRQDAVLECSTVYDLDYMLTIIRADKGFWLAPLSNPYLVYDLRAANPADGTEICLWPKNDLDHQKWYFDPA
ncbi:hypothetical protein BN14_11272 [Rhizoctonia solani AG-1 IB]|uniref:Ricin B lectin domain-containing protein n=1 Tax=Thanatephorus cucumeris (strain AG1-IB / isolate 7/3/14) TaxID=1108050 RepID=M5CCG5_THACB|nr:hypothetical protein BN14_11272 [Rhizoctonia solani AG-1 IB]